MAHNKNSETPTEKRKNTISKEITAPILCNKHQKKGKDKNQLIIRLVLLNKYNLARN